MEKSETAKRNKAENDTALRMRDYRILLGAAAGDGAKIAAVLQKGMRGVESFTYPQYD